MIKIEINKKEKKKPVQTNPSTDLASVLWPVSSAMVNFTLVEVSILCCVIEIRHTVSKDEYQPITK